MYSTTIHDHHKIHWYATTFVPSRWYTRGEPSGRNGSESLRRPR